MVRTALFDDAQQQPVQLAIFGLKARSRLQHRRGNRFQHRVARRQLADPRLVPALADLADLQAKTAQQTANAELDVV